MSTRFLMPCALAAALTFAIAGCGSSDSKSNGAPKPGDGHKHTYSHAEGPHGGHLAKLGDGKYQAEWLHDDKSGKVTIILLDADGDHEVTTDAASVTISVHVTGQDEKTFEIPAVAAASGSSGNSRFERVDPELVTLLKMEKGTHNTLSVEIDGQQLIGTLEHHHDDH